MVIHCGLIARRPGARHQRCLRGVPRVLLEFLCGGYDPLYFIVLHEADAGGRFLGATRCPGL